jgi:hypothetical protein
MAVPTATVAKQRKKAPIGGTTGALSQDETVAKILEGMEREGVLVANGRIYTLSN